MRVYYTRPLLRVVEETHDDLSVRGRLNVEITPAVEAWIKEFPRKVIPSFNYFSTLNEQLDYASEPIVYMPDEFSFHFDVEHLGRLAREFLISLLPMEAQIWQTGPDVPAGRSPLADLWLGGQGELLPKSERVRLQEVMREVWALPIRDKVFVLDDESLRDLAQCAGAPSAVREAGGIVHREVTPACDYYVTDRPDKAEEAHRAGAKHVLNHLALSVMVSGPH